MAIEMIREYLEIILKPLFECLKQGRQFSVIIADDSYLPTDRELECQRNDDASVVCFVN